MEVSGQLHTLAALPPRKEPLVLIGELWVCPRAVLDAVVKIKVHSPSQESNPGTPIVQPVASLLYRLSHHTFTFYLKPVPLAVRSKARSHQPLEHWDSGFESRSRHGCVSAFFCVVPFCVCSGLATGWSPVQGTLPNVQKYIHKFQSQILIRNRPEGQTRIYLPFTSPSILSERWREHLGCCSDNGSLRYFQTA
jgi:hypothetical protein